MHKKLLSAALLALCLVQPACAQVTDSLGQATTGTMGESAFTFTEAQLGEDENVSQNVTIVSSNTNVYASQVGYLFSPVRFRYRALSQKYNDIYINGAPMNDTETGQFRYSLVGGLNQQTKGLDSALPFEANVYGMAGLAGAGNYDFRPADMAVGHRITLSAANRNYLLRGMYTYNSGLNSKGWAFSANLTYRWANEGYVEGTFYNALSYFLGVQKVFGDRSQHSLSLVTWGNPTERASQGASTDEMYWLANDKQYNPYWGWQDGKKRNSRVVNDFSPSALLTWDWKIKDNTKLTTTLAGKYGMYSSTKLNYNNSDNPQPDYWKILPSSYYDVWDPNATMYHDDTALANWNKARDYLTASKENRQLNWDRLYQSNRNASAQGADAMYYIQKRHSDQALLSLSSALTTDLTSKSRLSGGFNMTASKTQHYQTMDDLLGASSFHNVNTYAIGNYAPSSDAVQYDLNHPNAVVKEGDKFAYDYDILVNKGNLWGSYDEKFGPLRYMVSGKVGGVTMQRDGHMRNGLFKDNSYGKSGTAKFFEGGAKAGANLSLGRGNTFTFGLGYEQRAPEASTAFAAAEMNNDFVTNLQSEHILSAELGYVFQTSWLHANVNAYYNYMTNVTDWTCFYFDDINSFNYFSITDMKKKFYGVEAGLNFKLTSAFNVKLIGTISEAKTVNNAHAHYLSSTKGTYDDGTLLSKDTHEDGTPLTAASVILSYHQGGWYIDLNTNYYDRIYLDYSPYHHLESVASAHGYINERNEVYAPAQSKGHGGFMVDGSIGRSIYLKHGSLSINLMVTNILNNTNICTGGYEQSRSDTTNSGNSRGYSFTRNPKKYYAYGTNGMLNIAYKF